jgi:hypothetical protein
MVGQRRRDSLLPTLNAGPSNFVPLKVLAYFVTAPLGIQLLGITLAAVAAAWFWAITPMTTTLAYICPRDWTDADLVRHLWHFRLIQPEWVGSPPQYSYLRWTQAEALARLCAVFLGWMGCVSWMSWRHAPGRTAYGKGRTPMPWGIPGRCPEDGRALDLLQTFRCQQLLKTSHEGSNENARYSPRIAHVDRMVTKLKLILCLALTSGVGLSARQPVSADPEGRGWGQSAHGFQMAASLDVTNGIIHCWLRNATTNEMDYQGFDIGYFELIHLEIMGTTNRTKFPAKVFPNAGAAYGGVPNYVRRIQPGKIITDTYIRSRYKPHPVLTHEEYLKFSAGNTNEALLTEQLNTRMASRQALLAQLCSNDTFALDLVADKVSDLKSKDSLEVKVTQTIWLDRSAEQKVTVSSQPFTLDGSVIEACIRRNRELWGK